MMTKHRDKWRRFVASSYVQSLMTTGRRKEEGRIIQTSFVRNEILRIDGIKFKLIVIRLNLSLTAGILPDEKRCNVILCCIRSTDRSAGFSA